MFYLKQSTAATIVIGPFVDSTDGATAETGLTISQADVRLSKNGGAFAQANESTSASHMENGYYSKALDTTDTNTLGQLLLAVNESGALPVWREYTVLAANVFDSLVGGGDVLDVSVATGGIAAASFAAGAIDAAAIATDAIGALELAAGAASEIASAVRTELTTELGRIDVAVSTRLAAAGYTAPLDAAGTRSAVGLASANLDTQLSAIDDFLDTEVAAIKAVTDKLNTTIEASAESPGDYKFTADALENAPIGEGGLTVGAIADAVWDEATSGHVSAGTFGKAIDDTDKRGSRTVVRGTVASGSTTSITASALSPSGAAADQFKGRIIIFDNDTATAALRGQATDITANTGVALPQFTVSALSDAPASGDTFSIV